jgi:glucose/arabinose dehydrogenase
VGNSLCERAALSFVVLLAFAVLIVIVLGQVASAQQENFLENNDVKPHVVKDHSLKLEEVARGLELPTTMAFLGPDDILVLEKNRGSVHRIVEGKLSDGSLLDVDSAQEGERGMLGIAVSKDTQNGITHTYVFIYFTQSPKSKDGGDDCPPPEPYYCKQGTEPLGNRLYRYELVNDKLAKPKLLLDLPATPGPNHNGGVVLVGPDNCVYTVTGDLLPYYDHELATKAINIRDSEEPDGRGGILRVAQNGHTTCYGVLGDNHPLNKYYAYGIRNSFGMDFDPVTKKLWDTENGPNYGDEINLVEPGFNSGWIQIQGIWKPHSIEDSENILDLSAGNSSGTPFVDKLFDFQGKGKYSTPEFTWKQTVGVTALKFLDSNKYGEEYKNDMFVGDFKNGRLYHFDLNNNRTELVLPGQLQDKIADTSEEVKKSNIVFAEGFGGITDLEVGPYDGYLYILSHTTGKIFRLAHN